MNVLVTHEAPHTYVFVHMTMASDDEKNDSPNVLSNGVSHSPFRSCHLRLTDLFFF